MMKRYQPAQQERSGKLVYLIADCQNNTILDATYTSEKRRNTAMAALNRNAKIPPVDIPKRQYENVLVTEQNILRTLVTNLASAGFLVASVWTGDDYQMASREGAETTGFDLQSAPQTITRALTADELLKVFDELDMHAPTIHFTHQHKTTWGNRGVMVVPGNGTDLISDWHCGDKAFNAIVDAVASAAYEGALGD